MRCDRIGTGFYAARWRVRLAVELNDTAMIGGTVILLSARKKGTSVVVDTVDVNGRGDFTVAFSTPTRIGGKV